jgi:quinol monooxygenase YgiN
MSNEIAWQVELTVESAMMDKFRDLTDEMIQSTAHEEGVLVYERFLANNGDKVFLYERYANSQAALSHLRVFQEKFGAAFSQLVNRERFLVFGTPSDELKQILDRYDAVFLSRIGGFSTMM